MTKIRLLKRKVRNSPKNFDSLKRFLIKKYVKENKSTFKLAEYFNCDYRSICRWLKIFKIPIDRLNYPSPFKNKHHTAKSKKLLSISHRGKKYNIDKKTQEKLAGLRSERMKGNKNPMFGKTGENHPCYIHGKGYNPYPIKFYMIKEQIRKRDNYTCQLCNITEKKHLIIYEEKLSIHHIDYNKNNCNEWNLITSCRKCNTKINHNRDYWYAYFTYIMVIKYFKE